MTVRDLIRELLEYPMEAEVLVEIGIKEKAEDPMPKCTGVQGDEDNTVTIKSDLFI